MTPLRPGKAAAEFSLLTCQLLLHITGSDGF